MNRESEWNGGAPLPAKRKKQGRKKPPPPPPSRTLPIAAWAGIGGGLLFLCLAVVVAILWRPGSEQLPPEPNRTAETSSPSATSPDAGSSEPTMPLAADAGSLPPAENETKETESREKTPAPEAATPQSKLPIAGADAPLPRKAESEPKEAATAAIPVPEPVPIENLPPLPPLVPQERSTVEDSAVVEFTKSLADARTVANALMEIETYLTAHDLTERQIQAIEFERRTWEERQAQNLVRYGGDWVGAEIAEAARKKADDLFDQAMGNLDRNQIQASLKLLNEASDADLNAIRADYVLGLLYTLPIAGLYDTDLAEKHFRAVLRRSPDNSAAMNSLAITLVKQGDEGAAFTLFQRASELSQVCPEVKHNLERFLFLVKDGRLRSKKYVEKRFLELLTELSAGLPESTFDQGIGWLHMLPVFVRDERQDADSPARDSSLIRVGYGSGFLIAPHYLVTNRHVVHDEDGELGLVDAVTILDPRDATHQRELPAKILNVSQNADLALLHVPGLDSVPLSVERDPQRLGEEVVILGYPESNDLGVQLKVTRGLISGLPDPERQLDGASYLFDATSGPGNSGGPVCDDQGNVIGVLTFGYNLTIQLTGGVTAAEVCRFAERTLEAPLPAPNPEGDKLSPAEIVERHSQSVVQVRVYRQAGVPSMDRAASQALGRNCYEDQTCPLCRGRATLGCPNAGCANGVVTISGYREQIVGEGSFATVVRVPTSRSARCTVCTGGKIKCPGCHDGIDRFLD